MWFYNSKEVTPADLQEYKSFVYCITCLVNNKQYIGKKRTVFVRHKRIKDKKRRIREMKPSDWETYYGSSSELAKDIVKYGKESFKREILYFCKTNALATYYELFEQMTRHVLLHPVDYYNNFVGAKIHRNHVYGKDK